jgi:glycosyltransferase involved in cell wall biosynthesis
MTILLRILYIITLPDLGGAQSHVLDLLRGFHVAADIHLATSAHGPLTEAAEALGVKVHIIPSLAHAIDPLSDLRSMQESLQLIRDLRPTIVHVHSSKAGLIGRVAARIAGLPVVFTAHGWGFKPGVPFIRRCLVWLSEAVVVPLAARIICVSDYDTQLARASLPGDPQRFVTIHNGLSPDTELAGADTDDITIIMTARFHEPKEQKLLLRAFALLDRPNARILFVGGGEELPVNEALADELGIAPRVQFLGDRKDVSALLAQSQIFVLLSRYEGFPISVLEAMRAGLPVIASAVGGIPEQVEHGVTGLLTPGGDAQAVASALQTLIDNAQLRREMGAAGRQKFLREFTVEQMILQIRDVYNQALALNASKVAYRPYFE